MWFLIISFFTSSKSAWSHIGNWCYTKFWLKYLNSSPDIKPVLEYQHEYLNMYCIPNIFKSVIKNTKCKRLLDIEDLCRICYTVYGQICTNTAEMHLAVLQEHKPCYICLWYMLFLLIAPTSSQQRFSHRTESKLCVVTGEGLGMHWAARSNHRRLQTASFGGHLGICLRIRSQQGSLTSLPRTLCQVWRDFFFLF